MLKAYPAIFKEDGDRYFIEFPDIQGAYTESDGMDVAHGIAMAEEVLGMVLADMVESGEDLPTPTPVAALEMPNNGLVTLIKVNLVEFFKNDEPVKKTLTIPTWANDLGIKEGINFSRLLTSAIANVATSTRDL